MVKDHSERMENKKDIEREQRATVDKDEKEEEESQDAADAKLAE